MDELPEGLDIHSLTREKHKDYIDGFLSGAMEKVLMEKDTRLHTANGKTFVVHPEFVNDFDNDDYNNAYYNVTVLAEE